MLEVSMYKYNCMGVQKKGQIIFSRKIQNIISGGGNIWSGPQKMDRNHTCYLNNNGRVT